jgi:hypothetical protein
MKQFRSLDWEAIAGIAAACVALVLHLLHIAEEGVLLAVALVVLALLLLRDLRREDSDEQEARSLNEVREAVGRLEAAVKKPEIILIGPRDLRAESERFARQARGEMLWFNVCLSMFEPQELFDVLLRPALENPLVTSVQFVLSPTEQSRWENSVMVKANQCGGAARLREPRWVELEETISFILADNAAGEAEAQVSFWGEPFMARRRGQDVPRYVLHVLAGSPLIGGLVEVERGYRSTGRV